MTDKIYAPFSKATQDVFKLLLDIDATTEESALRNIAGNDDKIHIMIGLTGDLSGEIHYSFPKETTMEMVKIMSGMDIDEVDDFVTSAMGEVANIISGNALTGLSEQNVTCDILPPKIIIGGAETAPAEDKASQTMNANIHTVIGDIDLGIKLTIDP